MVSEISSVIIVEKPFAEQINGNEDNDNEDIFNGKLHFFCSVNRFRSLPDFLG